MHPSTRAFLSDLIDYAGLFPPAEQSLDDAIRDYLRYRSGSDSWMLARFIIPAARLEALAGCAELVLDKGSTLRLSLLCGGRSEIDDFQETLDRDIARIGTFQDDFNGRVAIEVVEMKVPPSLFRGAGTGAIEAFLADTGERLARGLARSSSRCVEGAGAAPASTPALFFEPPHSAQWREEFETLASSLRSKSASMVEVKKAVGMGFKLRCGGVTAEAFPSSEQVASAIELCRDHDVPFKATAGLHHPIRHDNEGVGTRMHGFLNVFGAVLLAHDAGASGPDLQKMVEDENPEHFRFTPVGLSWLDRTITTEAIERLRLSRAVSFGSCSFDEPREDLRALGFLSSESVQEGEVQS